MTVTFNVLFHDEIGTFASDAYFKSKSNTALISIANGYEDGKWQRSKFNNYIWDNVAFTALSKRERDALAGKSQSELAAAARNLRLTDNDKVGEGSEIAEIVLYGLMNELFSALAVVPKIFYKQNVQDNAKGADGAHIVVSEDDFTLWFGEAKFYNSIADARLDSVVDSVIKSLSSDKLKKENSTITNVQDLDLLGLDPNLVSKIKSALDPKESIDSLKPKIHVPILILHECQITQKEVVLSEEYKEAVRDEHKDRAESYYKKQIKKSGIVFKYDSIHFHLILFPVPKKEEIVKSFTEAVKFHKDC